MQNYVKKGRVLDLNAPYAVVGGAGALIGHIFGVACDSYANGAAGEFEVVGVFDLAKDVSTFAAGDYVYWDNTAKLATSTATSNTKIGVAEADAVVAGTVRVRLSAAF